MTRELAIKVIKRMIKTGIAYDDGYAYEPLTQDEEKACGMAIKALEQEPQTDTLKQIREEITCAMDREPAWKGQDNYVGGLEIALSIIDKTMSEVSE